jgi:hypothetical protein
MELMKTNRIKRIFLPVHTSSRLESSISAFDLACSLSRHPQHRTTPLVLVLDIGEELTEDQEHRMDKYPFVGVLRMPLSARDFRSALETSLAAVEMNATPSPIVPAAYTSALSTLDANAISIFVVNTPNCDEVAFGTLLEEIARPIGKTFNPIPKMHRICRLFSHTRCNIL